MRLSNTQKLLACLLLNTFLTLFLKPAANAQSTPVTKVFAYNDYSNKHNLFNEPADEPPDIATDKHSADEKPNGAPLTTPLYFRRSLENITSDLLASPSIKNNFKVSPPHNFGLARVYSIDLYHSARLTFKLFKLIIVPL